MTILSNFLFITFFYLVCLLTITNAEVIDSLPGQPSKNVSFKQHSGYIVTDDDHGRALFYYFAEAQSKNKLSLPLTLWLGGAFGCTSLGIGVFLEHGPFRLSKHDKLIKNEYSWNLESNMLYIDTPIGAGFSYSNTSSDYAVWDEPKSANDNMKFLLKWFDKFPQYRKQDFYIAGDAFGGHLAPQLAAVILEYNANSHGKPPIKLKGIALGNPVLDIKYSLSYVENLWYRGAISEETFHMQKTLCSMGTYFTELALGNVTKQCNKMIDILNNEVGDINMDNMFSPPCLSTEYVGNEARDTSITDPCIDEKLDTYMNNPQVQRALHANSTGLPYSWNMYCEGGTDYEHLEMFAHDVIPTVSALLKRHIRVMLYSGDQDLMVAVTQTRKIASKLARDLKLNTLHNNRPWYNGKQIGGWSQTYGRLKKGKAVIQLTFATVKGGGNYVPYSSPSEALILFKAFLKGSPPPTRPS